MIPLSPRGTMCSRFGAPAAGPPFPPALADAMTRADMPAELGTLAWDLVRLVEDPGPEEAEALLVLIVALLASARAGSTRLPLSAGDSILVDLLARIGFPATVAKRVLSLAARLPSLAGGKLMPLVGLATDYAPLIVDGPFLYPQRLFTAEERLARDLEARRAATATVFSPPQVDQALDLLASRPTSLGGAPLLLDEEQRRAVRAALESPLTAIAGGPGTGKTSIVVAILRTLVRLDVEPRAIALAAPTGKAAHRMTEAVKRSLLGIASPDPLDQALIDSSPTAETLHRLLGYSPATGRFAHHENNRLAARMVIVDECSMIDLHLMDQLVRALRRDARLVLLGDVDQLPSVEAGNVLRDLIEAGTARAVRLVHSYRMRDSEVGGRAILRVAGLVNEGGATELYADGPDGPIRTRSSVADIAWQGVEHIDAASPSTRDAFLARWFVERVLGLTGHADLVGACYRYDGSFTVRDRERLDTLFGHLEGHRILTLTRGDQHPAGAGAVNAALHHRMLAEARRRGLVDGRPVFFPGFCPGEPVMMLRNDYERLLFNGDQGIVLRVLAGARPRLMAVFPRGDGYVAFPLDALRDDLALSYAMTVHKAQGSELDHVGLLLPDADLPLLTREVLYTAVSRSRRSVVIVGSQELLRKGVASPIRRCSGLREKLERRT